MITHSINPILLSLGQFEIRYYGLIFALGFVFGALFLYFSAKKNQIKNFSEKDVSNYVIYLILGVIIFSRIFAVLFYEFDYYISNPLQVFAVWNGGLSFHGGLFGAVLVTLIYVKAKKINFYELADLLVLPAAIGLAFGRFANFINAELYGKITNLPWCVKFPNADGCRHPTQIYESLKNIIIFFSLLAMKSAKPARGFLFWHFILLYGILRFMIEFLKPVGWYFLSLNTGQWFCMIMIGISAIFIFRERYYA